MEVRTAMMIETAMMLEEWNACFRYTQSEDKKDWMWHQATDGLDCQ